MAATTTTATTERLSDTSTRSAGLASWPVDGHQFEEVLRRADERLYQAKSSGRNVVIGPLPVALRSAGETGV